MSNKNEKPRTRVAIVLDNSHSMAKTLEQALSGFNEEIEILQNMEKEGQEVLVSIFTFCGEIKEHQFDVKPSEVKKLTIQDYVLGDWTAFREAVGVVIKRMRDSGDPNDKKTAYLMRVISDGENNKNISFDGQEGLSRLKELVQSVQNTGRWTISYLLGCSANYIEQVARETGVPLANTGAWDNKNYKSTTYGLRMSNSKTSDYFKSRSEGVMASCNFMSKVSGKAEDFTDVDESNNLTTLIPPILPNALGTATTNCFSKGKTVSWNNEWKQPSKKPVWQNIDALKALGKPFAPPADPSPDLDEI